MTVSLRMRSGRDPAAVERLLRGLPEWFGIESSIAEYVEAAGRLSTLLAYAKGTRRSARCCWSATSRRRPRST